MPITLDTTRTAIVILAGNPMRSDYGLAAQAIERAIRVATSI